jgi:hypothetical protein
MMKKWIGDVIYGVKLVSVFVEVEPKYEILDGEMVTIASEFLGYGDEGQEVWT